MKCNEKSLFAALDQKLLLRAALLKGTDAVDAWNAWESAVDWEGHLENRTFDLLPLLYMNLQRLGVDHPHMNILKGIYRQAWYKNQRFFSEAGRTLASLHKTGVHTMVLKGIPLTVLHYKNYGVRPMSTIDILVPSSEALLTADALNKVGWSPMMTAGEDYMQYQHPLRFLNKSGMELALHRYLIFKSSRSDSDSDFWNKAVPIVIHHIPAYAQNPADMLFHVIVDGAKWNPEPSIHWIADAITIMQSSHTEVDWSRIINQAKKHKVSLQMKEALHYLDENFQAGVPKTIMDRTKSIPVSSLEQFEYRRVISCHETDRETLLGGFPLYLIEYLRLTRDTGLWPALAGFPKFLKYRLDEKNYLHLVFSLLSRIIKTIRRKLSGFMRRKSMKPEDAVSGRGNVFR